MQSLLVDTDILVLLIIGTWDRDSVGAHRRTETFTPRDYDRLRAQINQYGRVVTTQPVLTEVSNLMGNDFHAVVADTLVQVCVPMVEVVRPKEAVFETKGFERLGFADASILAAMDPDTVVLTDDVSLYSQVWFLGSTAVNFNHLRQYAS